MTAITINLEPEVLALLLEAAKAYGESPDWTANYLLRQATNQALYNWVSPAPRVIIKPEAMREIRKRLKEL